MKKGVRRSEVKKSVNTLIYKKLSEITADELDDVVTTAAECLASDANNGGRDSQLDFLITVCGWSEKDILDKVNE